MTTEQLQLFDAGNTSANGEPQYDPKDLINVYLGMSADRQNNNEADQDQRPSDPDDPVANRATEATGNAGNPAPSTETTTPPVAPVPAPTPPSPNQHQYVPGSVDTVPAGAQRVLDRISAHASSSTDLVAQFIARTAATGTAPMSHGQPAENITASRVGLATAPPPEKYTKVNRGGGRQPRLLAARSSPEPLPPHAATTPPPPRAAVVPPPPRAEPAAPIPAAVAPLAPPPSQETGAVTPPAPAPPASRAEDPVTLDPFSIDPHTAPTDPATPLSRMDGTSGSTLHEEGSHVSTSTWQQRVLDMARDTRVGRRTSKNAPTDGIGSRPDSSPATDHQISAPVPAPQPTSGVKPKGPNPDLPSPLGDRDNAAPGDQPDSLAIEKIDPDGNRILRDQDGNPIPPENGA